MTNANTFIKQQLHQSIFVMMESNETNCGGFVASQSIKLQPHYKCHLNLLAR